MSIKDICNLVASLAEGTAPKKVQLLKSLLSALLSTEGWMEVLDQKSKDGHVLHLLFSSEYIISYYSTLTFHITLSKLSFFFFNNVYTHH